MHTGQGMEQSELQALRQACGEALHVEFWRVAPFRLQEDLPSHMSHMTRPAHNGGARLYDDQAGLFRSPVQLGSGGILAQGNSSQAADYKKSECEPESYNRVH